MSKRIVITGASGNVGTALPRRLVDGGHDYGIVGVSRRQPPAAAAGRCLRPPRLASTGPGRAGGGNPAAQDLSRRRLRGPSRVGVSPTRNTRYLDAVAINGSSALLSAAHNAKVPHLVHLSSVGTYAAGRYGERVDETWSTAGIRSSAYSRAKSAVETMLDGYEQRNPDGVGITRMSPASSCSAPRRPAWPRRIRRAAHRPGAALTGHGSVVMVPAVTRSV